MRELREPGPAPPARAAALGPVQPFPGHGSPWAGGRARWLLLPSSSNLPHLLPAARAASPGRPLPPGLGGRVGVPQLLRHRTCVGRRRDENNNTEQGEGEKEKQNPTLKQPWGRVARPDLL